MLADFKISVPKRKPDRIELFNLRDKKCQEIFSQETESNPELFQCFDSHLPFEVQCKIWLKNFNSIVYKCFKKVRITNNKKKKGKYDDLLHERIELKKEAKLTSINEEMKRKIEERIFQIENQVSNEISEKYVEEIVEVLKKLGGDGQHLSGSGRKEIWKILKKQYPKCETAVPIGKKDKSDNIVSNHEGLKDLYLNTYMHRLRNRPVKKEYEDMKAYKDDLFDLRLKLARLNKSFPWEMEDLELVLKSMKEGKSRDPMVGLEKSSGMKLQGLICRNLC